MIVAQQCRSPCAQLGAWYIGPAVIITGELSHRLASGRLSALCRLLLLMMIILQRTL